MLIKLELDLFYDGHSNNHKGNPVGLELRAGSIDKKVSIYLDDYCDCVEGYFKSKEDVIRLRDALNKIIEEI